MGSTFGGISTALSGMQVAQRAMELAGQNIANVNTEGYSRQRANIDSVPGTRVPAMYATGDTNHGGAKITDISRVRDEFLEARGRAEHGQSSYLDGKQRIYSHVEQVVGEPSDTGLQAQMSEFWAGWHDLANRPGDDAARTQTLARASELSDTVRGKHSALTSLWGSTREQLDVAVDDVNNTALAVADLNERIVLATQSGMPANELSDKRDQLVLRLSESTGASARMRENGAVDVVLDGNHLVSGGSVRKLEVAGATGMATQGASPVVVRWADTDATVNATSGRLAASLESLGSIIPGAATALDGVAAALANSVNTQHKAGFDLAGAAGENFFSGTTASTLTVAISDLTKLAASSSATTKFDGKNADALALLATSITGGDAMYRKFVVDLGVSAQAVSRRSDAQNVIMQDVDSARLGESGVSLDEEMTNLMAFQRSYQAAARVMNTIDSALETLINSTGR